MKTADFAYHLPSELIAQSPVEPRDSARLLRASDLSDWTVRDLPTLLEPGDLVVVNETRGRAACLVGYRDPTGGRVKLLLLGREGSRWKALLKPSRRILPGSVIRVGPLVAIVETDPADGMVELTLEAGGDGPPGREVEGIIAGIGRMPLPPYIHQELDDPERYQTVFGRNVGSAAAPTAGLHLTNHTMGALANRGIGLARVELQIGLDTFRPISVEDVADHVTHSEWIDVPGSTVKRIAETKAEGGRIVAVGTTVVRVLETACGEGEMAAYRGPTRLYITPAYRFGAVDVLMTNFHMPSSSLLVLAAAFVGEAWRDVYQTAVDRRYRFLSFGDAMLLERSEALSPVR